jgi:hypothetical protein
MESIPEKAQKREKFSKEEDQKLCHLVSIFGSSNWSFISTLHGTKNATQCRGRWFRYLSPSISKELWSEEDQKLIEFYMKYGSKWSFISHYFQGRSDLSVKNRFAFLINRKMKK